MVSKSQKLSSMGFENDIFESAAQRNLVDINDYYKRKANSDNYASLKPSLKPLKWPKNKRIDAQREPDLDALAAAQKKIVYIKTFNHVKNEAIIAQAENNAIKSAQNFTHSVIQPAEKYNSRKKPVADKIDYALTLSIFKKNKEKFNPVVKPPKKKKSLGELKSDDSSTIKDFEFLTGVNIQGAEQDEPEEEEEEDRIYANEDQASGEYNVEQKNLESKRYKSGERISEKGKDAEGLQSIKEQTNLPHLKKSMTSNEKQIVSVSEARYKKYMEKKPKIFISFKTNSVQPYGRPADYQDHLLRVFNKEATPSAQYHFVNHIAAKKDMKKVILDCYLSQYNLEALKDLDEELYEYAKQQQQEQSTN